MKEVVIKILLLVLLIVCCLFTVKYLINNARQSERQIQTANCEVKIRQTIDDMQQKQRELEAENVQKTNDAYSSAPAPIDDIINLMRQSKM